MNPNLRTPKRAQGLALRGAPGFVWSVQHRRKFNLITVWLEPWFDRDANDYVFDVVDVFTRAGTAELRRVPRRDTEAVRRSCYRVPWASLPDDVMNLIHEQRSRLHHD